MKTESDTAITALIIGVMLLALAIMTFGQTLSAFIGAIATIVVGTAALMLARQQLQTNRDLARIKNTLDFIFKFDTDKYYTETRSAWAEKYEAKPEELEGYCRILASLRTDSPLPKSQSYIQICDFIVMLEVMAIGIKNGIFDAEVLMESYALQFLIYRNGVRPYAEAYRTLRGEQHILQNFEDFCERCVAYRGGRDFVGV